MNTMRTRIQYVSDIHLDTIGNSIWSDFLKTCRGYFILAGIYHPRYILKLPKFLKWCANDGIR